MALILGAAAATIGWFLAGLLAPPAIVVGHLALADTRRHAKTGRGLAIGGLILAYVGAIPLLVALVILGYARFGGSFGP